MSTCFSESTPFLSSAIEDSAVDNSATESVLEDMMPSLQVFSPYDQGLRRLASFIALLTWPTAFCSEAGYIAKRTRNVTRVQPGLILDFDERETCAVCILIETCSCGMFGQISSSFCTRNMEVRTRQQFQGMYILN